MFFSCALRVILPDRRSPPGFLRTIPVKRLPFIPEAWVQASVVRAGDTITCINSCLPIPVGGGITSLFRWKTGLMILRSDEHTSELQSLMRHSYAVFCLKKKSNNIYN